MKTALFCVVALAFVACAYAGHSFRVEPLSLDVKKDPEIRCPGQSRIEFDFPRFIISNKEEGVRFETKEMDYNKGKSAYVFEDVSFKHRAKFFRNLEKISVHVRPINNVWGDIDDPFQPVEFTTAGIHTVNLKFKKEQCQSPTFTMTIQVTETDVEGNPIQSKVQQSSVVHKKGEHVQVIFKKLLTVKDPQIECPDEDIDFWFPYGVASVVGSHQVHASEKAKEMEWIKSKPGHYGYHKDTEKRGLVDIPNLILTDGKPAVQISLGNAELGRDSFPFAPKTVTGYGLHTVNLRPAKSECTHPGFTVQVEVKKA